MVNLYLILFWYSIFWEINSDPLKFVMKKKEFTRIEYDIPKCSICLDLCIEDLSWMR